MKIDDLKAIKEKIINFFKRGDFFERNGIDKKRMKEVTVGKKVKEVIVENIAGSLSAHLIKMEDSSYHLLYSAGASAYSALINGWIENLQLKEEIKVYKDTEAIIDLMEKLKIKESLPLSNSELRRHMSTYKGLWKKQEEKNKKLKKLIFNNFDNDLIPEEIIELIGNKDES